MVLIKSITPVKVVDFEHHVGYRLGPDSGSVGTMEDEHRRTGTTSAFLSSWMLRQFLGRRPRAGAVEVQNTRRGDRPHRFQSRGLIEVSHYHAGPLRGKPLRHLR